jgi:hypothetical protein
MANTKMRVERGSEAKHEAVKRDRQDKKMRRAAARAKDRDVARLGHR